MDDADLRLAAIEKVILAVMPWVHEDLVADAVATLESELQAATGDERRTVSYALELLTDGRDRFRSPFTLGAFVQRRWVRPGPRG